ncbi:DUF3048 domain-containing protein [Bacillus massiliglaciei]|uniref:DUF3048 domain-containing protein n=1 Tax=Bacillus massiliglaciei TaxID=1816693 RepID=UPI000A415752|nr:DUF3048 domain-containing protein [Bacillus massiliglaciei]
MKFKFLLILTVMLLLAAGCAKKEDVKEETSRESEPQTGTEQDETPVYPLSGTEADGETDRRAVAVMVNNHTQARPQTGLSKADVVYEMLAEGEITRFLAVFQSEVPDQVGPVRSARDYYIEIAKGLDAIFVTHGNSPEAKQLMDSGYIDSVNGLQYDGTLFQRSDDRKAPHNSYTTYDNIMKASKEKGYEQTSELAPLKFLSDDEEAELEGEAAADVRVNYGKAAYNVQYTYNKTEQKYARSSNGVQTKDQAADQPIWLDNVFIIEAPHKVTDKKGRRDIDLKSGGKGYLLQKGIMNEVEWENREGRIVPVKNGEEARMVPGKTWVNIVPDQPGLSGEVSFED